MSKKMSESIRNKKQIKNYNATTSGIKYWGLSGYLKRSAPYQFLQRQTGTKPAIPNVLYMYPLAFIKETEFVLK